MDGRIQKFVSEQALLDQDFIKDTSKTVATVVREASAAIGEKVSIRRFQRYTAKAISPCCLPQCACMHVQPPLSRSASIHPRCVLKISVGCMVQVQTDR